MSWIRWLFVVGALYDGILGLAFLAFARELFERTGVTPPNHFGYVQFPALVLIVFAAMFVQIARDPVRHRDLILYGCGLKVAYCSVVLTHWLRNDIPSMWVWFAWSDLVFLALFAIAWNRLRSEAVARTHGG